MTCMLISPAMHAQQATKSVSVALETTKPQVRRCEQCGAEALGVAYIPMDSWVYAAADRLSALGVIRSGIGGIRPWTRREVARLLEEAEQADAEGRLSGEAPNDEAVRLLAALKNEFVPELEESDGKAFSISVDELYWRAMPMDGTPLNDSYHVSRTVVNDFGRSYGSGWNQFAGFSARAAAGPLLITVQGEYAQSAAPLNYSQAVLEKLAEIDQVPFVAAGEHREHSFRLIEAYAAMEVRGVEVSFGKQNLWWGPGAMGPMTFSTNAEPLYMLKLSRVSPRKLPSIFSWLGPARGEFFIGKLEGHRNPAGPYLHGQKLSFKPTPNLELGFSRAVMFAGAGRGLTLGNFWRSLVSVGDHLETAPGSRLDVGDRRGGFDVSYRLPKLRDRALVYLDSFVDDDMSPLAAPQRAGLNPGIYLPRLPKLPRMDFRAEAAFTSRSQTSDFKGRFFYWNLGYRDGYTSNGNLLGSWVGRQGTAVQAWTTYWTSGATYLRISGRALNIDDKFLPGGGTVRSIAAEARLRPRPQLEMSVLAQYERWVVPLLATDRKSNFTFNTTIRYRPTWVR